MQGAIRDKIAKETVIWKKKSACLALSMNYDYSKGGKSLNICQKDWRVKGQLESSARVTMHYLFRKGRTESLSIATHTLLETLAHRELMKHFLQRARAGYLRKVIDSTLGTDMLTFPVRTCSLCSGWTQSLWMPSLCCKVYTGCIV